MEVGIEDCLHIEFEYDKGKYHLKDTVVGKIYFLLVRFPTHVPIFSGVRQDMLLWEACIIHLQRDRVLLCCMMAACPFVRLVYLLYVFFLSEGCKCEEQGLPCFSRCLIGTVDFTWLRAVLTSRQPFMLVGAACEGCVHVRAGAHKAEAHGDRDPAARDDRHGRGRAQRERDAGQI